MWAILKMWMGETYEFLKPIIEMYKKPVGAALRKAAIAAVLAVAERQITGDKKKKEEAFRMIEADLKTQGIELGISITTSMINHAIETAVQGLKQK